jgi:hypothetical protein
MWDPFSMSVACESKVKLLNEESSIKQKIRTTPFLFLNAEQNHCILKKLERNRIAVTAGESNTTLILFYSLLGFQRVRS